MHLQRLLAVSFWICAVFSTGCRTSRLTLYPDFAAQKSAMKKLTIVSDFTILQSGIGDTQQIDLDLNKSIGVKLLDFVADELNVKGYPVDNRLLASVGLLSTSVALPLVPPAAGETGEIQTGAEIGPPFYLAPVFARDSLMYRALGSLFWNLFALPEKKEQTPDPVFPEARLMGRGVGGGAILVMETAAYFVPVARELTMESFQKGPPHGMIGFHEVSQLTMVWYLLDGETGKVLWSGRDHRVGGSVFFENMKRMAGRLIEDLP